MCGKQNAVLKLLYFAADIKTLVCIKALYSIYSPPSKKKSNIPIVNDS